MILPRRVALALIAVLAVAAVVSGIAYFSISSHPSASAPVVTLTPGKVAPAFDVPSVANARQRVSSAAWHDKPVVLSFFASWCPGCKQELPLLSKASKRWGSAVDFVGLDVNDSKSNALRLLRSDHVTYPVGADPQDSVTNSYALSNLPTTVFVGTNGRVVHVNVGAVTSAVLATWIPRLGH